MKPDYRIQLDDSRLFPVQAFFNALSEQSFVRDIETLAAGIGLHDNEVHCRFPVDLNPDEEPFNGAKFSIFGDTTVVTIDVLVQYARIACEAHLRHHPQDRLRIDAALSRMAQLRF